VGDDNSPAGGHISFGEGVFLITGITNDVRATQDDDGTCLKVRALIEYGNNIQGLVGVGVENRVLYLGGKEHLIPLKYSSYAVPDSRDWGVSDKLPVILRRLFRMRQSFRQQMEAVGCAGTIAVAGACLLGYAFFAKGCREVKASHSKQPAVSRSVSYNE
jgi:hypothetical protein